jgi:hypothetical protein
MSGGGNTEEACAEEERENRSGHRTVGEGEGIERIVLPTLGIGALTGERGKKADRQTVYLRFQLSRAETVEPNYVFRN